MDASQAPPAAGEWCWHWERKIWKTWGVVGKFICQTNRRQKNEVLHSNSLAEIQSIEIPQNSKSIINNLWGNNRKLKKRGGKARDRKSNAGKVQAKEMQQHIRTAKGAWSFTLWSRKIWEWYREQICSQEKSKNTDFQPHHHRAQSWGWGSAAVTRWAEAPFPGQLGVPPCLQHSGERPCSQRTPGLSWLEKTLLASCSTEAQELTSSSRGAPGLHTRLASLQGSNNQAHKPFS